MPEEKTEIGTVITSMNGPSPIELDFVVTEGNVHRGQFVELDYSEGTMVCMVTNVMKTNRYFERAEAVKEFEASGRKLFEQFPASEWEYLLAKTHPVGVYQQGKLKRASFPPSPGTKVKIASPQILKNFLGFEENGLHWGELEYHPVSVKLNLSRLLKKHIAILAQSGFGKSIAVKSLIEEALSRKKEEGRIAIVVMDAHGEYTNFAEAAPKNAKNYSHQTLVVNAPDVRMGVPKLNVNLISSIVSGLSNPQKRVLQRILKNLQEEMRSGMGPFDFATVKKAIGNDSEVKGETQTILQSWIGILEDLRLFAKTDLPSVSDLVKPGQLTVIDLSSIIDQRKKQIIVSHFANTLFHERQKGKVPPFLLVIEEAHQFCAEKTKEENSISKRIIETISREGRKFGASLCLVSQRPVHLSTTALANCSSHLILHISNPYDLKHIGESSEGIDHDAERMISGLRVGEALLVGEAVNFPVFFKVRKNYSADSRHEKTMEQAAREFEEAKSLVEKEAEEFL